MQIIVRRMENIAFVRFVLVFIEKIIRKKPKNIMKRIKRELILGKDNIIKDINVKLL
jgi:hypothetical protein